MDRGSEIPIELKGTPAQFLALVALNRYTMLLWVPAAVFGVVGLFPYTALSAIDSRLGALLQFLGETVSFPDLATLGSLHGTSQTVGAKAGFVVSIVVILVGLYLDFARYIRSAKPRPPFKSKKRTESIAELVVTFCVATFWFYGRAIGEAADIPVDRSTASDVVSMFVMVAIETFILGAFVFFFSRRFYRLLPRASTMVRRH